MNFFEGMGDEKMYVRRNAHPSARTQPFQLKNKKRISQGGFFADGGVFSADAYHPHDKKGRSIPVVIKRYSKEYDNKFNQLQTIHSSMKQDGLKVPMTLRFDIQKQITIASDLNLSGYTALSQNNDSDLVPLNSLEKIPGFERLVKDMVQHAIVAGSKGYELTADSYFILIPSRATEDADFFVADFDIVQRVHLAGSDKEIVSKQREIIEMNLIQLHNCIRNFCTRWLRVQDSIQPYLNQAESIISATQTKYESE